MPYIKENEKPSFLTNPQRETAHQDSSVSKEGSSKFDVNKQPKLYGTPLPTPNSGNSFANQSVRAYDLERRFKSLPVRKEIMRSIGAINPYSKDVNDVIKRMTKKLEKFGSIIDPEEMKSMTSPAKLLEAYWDHKKHMQEEMKDQQITPEELKDRKKISTAKRIIGKFFGLKK